MGTSKFESWIKRLDIPHGPYESMGYIYAQWYLKYGGFSKIMQDAFAALSPENQDILLESMNNGLIKE